MESLRSEVGEPWQADVTVTEFIEELGKFIAYGDDGLRLTISEQTQGVSFAELKVGQQLRVRLEGRAAPKVLSAELA